MATVECTPLSNSRLTTALDVLLAETTPENLHKVNARTRSQILYLAWTACNQWQWPSIKPKTTHRDLEQINPECLVSHRWCQVVAEFVNKIPEKEADKLLIIATRLV